MGLDQTASAYLRTKVMSASREELRLMLLDGALKFAHQGREGLVKKNYEQSFAGISQCRDIVTELLTTIKPEYDPALCERVRSLYAFMYSQLVEASMERDLQKLDNVIKLLAFERETWVLLMEKLREERAKGTGQPLKLAEPAAAGQPRPISVVG